MVFKVPNTTRGHGSALEPARKPWGRGPAGSDLLLDRGIPSATPACPAVWLAASGTGAVPAGLCLETPPSLILPFGD